MKLSKQEREAIKQKFGGRCAYSGTILKDDWEIDHIRSRQELEYFGLSYLADNLDNLVPCQKIINHYKRALPLEEFRTWYLGGLHERLKKLPKNPQVPKSIRRKKYLLKVAELFGITEDKPFSGKFYFETLNDK